MVSDTGTANPPSLLERGYKILSPGSSRLARWPAFSTSIDPPPTSSPKCRTASPFVIQAKTLRRLRYTIGGYMLWHYPPPWAQHVLATTRRFLGARWACPLSSPGSGSIMFLHPSWRIKKPTLSAPSKVDGSFSIYPEVVHMGSMENEFLLRTCVLQFFRGDFGLPTERKVWPETDVDALRPHLFDWCGPAGRFRRAPRIDLRRSSSNR